jgi:hypothetical protein
MADHESVTWAGGRQAAIEPGLFRTRLVAFRGGGNPTLDGASISSFRELETVDWGLGTAASTSEWATYLHGWSGLLGTGRLGWSSHPALENRLNPVGDVSLRALHDRLCPVSLAVPTCSLGTSALFVS